MATEQFTSEVEKALGHYVYRLIDPRNGETFYVGKGQGNRIFAHVSGALKDADQSVADPKLERIHEIRGLGMNVEHVIHRHGMTNASAREVEAALIDAYPGLTNKVAGLGSGNRGTRHVKEIVLEYSAQEFELKHKLILISVAQMGEKWGIYEAVRGLWSIDVKRVEREEFNLVLAHIRGLVRGAYVPKKWMCGSKDNFPLHDWSVDRGKYEKKKCFIGCEAEPEVWNRYVLKRVPAIYRKKGAANPVRYLHPD